MQADTVASGSDSAFVLQSDVNHSAIPWAQRIQRNRPPLAACFVRQTPCHICERLSPPGAVASRIDHYVSLVWELTGYGTIHDVLDCVYGLPVPTDDHTRRVAIHLQHDFIVRGRAGFDLHGSLHTHELQGFAQELGTTLSSFLRDLNRDPRRRRRCIVPSYIRRSLIILVTPW
jgi:hypothetical protein